MLWACLLLPQLALDDDERSNEDVSPLVIVEGVAQRRVVRYANLAAHRGGIRTGLPLAAAHALLPAFRCVAYDPERETRLREFIAGWAYGYSSMISLREPAAVMIEIGASVALFGPWPQFERKLRADLEALRITHRLGVAPTALGARVMAGVQDGFAVTQMTSFLGALDHVQLEYACLAERDVVALKAMGVRRLRELFALPRDGVAKRFSPELLDRLDRLRGCAPDPLPLHHPPDRFETRMEFDHAIESSETLLFPLKRLLGDLCTYLNARDRGVQQFELVLHHGDHPTSILTIGLQSAQRSIAALFDVCRLKIQGQPAPGAVRALGIRAAHLHAFVPDAIDMFGDQVGSQLAWPQLADRLRARLGADKVYQLIATDDPRPENAWRRRTGADAPRRQDEAPVADRSRPTWLFRRPLPLHGSPREILAGPERIESGWWDSEDICRDYYVIETRHGQRAWAFQLAGAAGRWMLHGWFA
jgi:protein ImuB